MFGRIVVAELDRLGRIFGDIHDSVIAPGESRDLSGWQRFQLLFDLSNCSQREILR